jgi:uncharacterized membrane protein
MPTNPHPLIVHFPIALLMAAVLFDAVAYFSKRDAFEKAAHWNLILGLVTAGVAVVTGLLAEETVPQFEVMQETAERHETFAFVTLGVFAILCLWRIWKRGEFFNRLRTYYLLFALVGLVSLSITAYYGGELVYKFGVGTQPPQVNK